MIAKACTAALIALLPVAGIAQTAEDRDAAEARVNEFVTAFEDRDIRDVISFTPISFWDHLATRFGQDTETVLAAMETQMAQVMEAVEIEEIRVPFDEARGGLSPEDRPYFVTPVETTMTLPGQGRIRARSDMLVFRDDGAWWLLRVEADSHRAMLAEAYPDLAGIAFADGTMEPLE